MRLGIGSLGNSNGGDIGLVRASLQLACRIGTSITQEATALNPP